MDTQARLVEVLALIGLDLGLIVLLACAVMLQRITRALRDIAAKEANFTCLGRVEQPSQADLGPPVLGNLDFPNANDAEPDTSEIQRRKEALRRRVYQ